MIDQDRLEREAITLAQQLVGAVHECNRRRIGELIRNATPQQRYSVIVTLAAMVDPDRKPSDLLAWLDDPQTYDARIDRQDADKARQRREKAA